MTYSQVLEKMIAGRSMTEPESYQLMVELLSGRYSGEKISGLLVALRCKGETEEEIAGFLRAMREFAVKVETDRPVVDTCGTEGDGTRTFNISTVAAFVAAGAGVAVAKHGNRSVSSQCGSADVLENPGVNLKLEPEQVKASVESIGIGFCFAPLYHQSLKYAAGPRKELGVRTVFNMLGPLLNPFLAKRQVIGVFREDLTGFVASILRRLGSRHVFVVYSRDGLDEVSISDETIIAELKDGSITTRRIVPEVYGFKRVPQSEIIGGDAPKNALILTDILSGRPGPCRDIVILNAALAVVCSGLCDTIDQGIEQAKYSIDSGAALDKLHQLIAFSHQKAAACF